MSYDGVATAAAVSELQQNLTLGKIEKIYQPHSEQLIFNIHTESRQKKTAAFRQRKSCRCISDRNRS